MTVTPRGSAEDSQRASQGGDTIAASDGARSLLSDVDSSIAAFVAGVARPNNPRPAGEHLPLGHELAGHLVLERFLGQGGMGEVYLARDVRLDRVVAVKRVTRRSPHAEARLASEGRAMARLRHPNVVVVHEVDASDDGLFIAMEYVDGTTLRRWCAAEDRPWRVRLDALLQAARGLAAAHEAGIVHHDFKPENVLVGRDGRVQVADFGLARIADAEQTAATDSEPAAFGVGGTPSYMAPESFAGADSGELADQFSFGVTAYEVLCGFRPYGTLALGATIGDLRRPSAKLPRWLRDVLVRACALAPGERFSDMTALIRAVERGQAGASRRTRLLVVGGVATLAAVVGLRVGTHVEQIGCETPEPRLDAAWNDARRVAIRERFAAALPGGELVWNGAEAALDRHFDEWRATRRDACVDARVEGVISEAVWETAQSCLDERLDEAISLLDVLARADANVVLGVNEVIARVPTPLPCRDERFLRRHLRGPDDPAKRARSLELWNDLNYAIFDSGATPEELRARLEVLGERAEELGDVPMQARVEFERGRFEAGLGNFDVARTQLERAFFRARGVTQDGLAAEAAAQLAYIDARTHPDPRAAEIWIAQARAEYSSGGADEHVAAATEHVAGLVSLETGHAERAIEELRASLVHAGRTGALGPGAQAEIRGSLATALAASGDTAAALEQFAAALVDIEATLGATSYPAAIIFNNRGELLTSIGRSEDAIVDLERALEIETQIFGERSPRLVAPLLNLGIGHAASARFDEALVRLEAALALTDLAGAEPGDRPLVLAAIGWIAKERGEHERAIGLLKEALALQEQRLPKGDVEVAVTHVHLASALRLRGDLDAATEHLDAATKIYDSADIDDPREVEVHSERAAVLEARARIAK